MFYLIKLIIFVIISILNIEITTIYFNYNKYVNLTRVATLLNLFNVCSYYFKITFENENLYNILIN